MLQISSRTGASATRRVGKVGLLQLLIDLMENDPTASKEVMFRKWRTAIINDPEDVDVALLYTFTNLWETAERDRKQMTKPQTTRDPAQIEAKKAQVAEVREQIVRKVFSLDFVMPNGQQLGDCTFGYLEKVGGVFVKISKMGKPNQVIRKVLTAKKLEEAARE
jgi:hypothetical protein